MALILAEGFESYTASAYIDIGTNRKWDAGSAASLFTSPVTGARNVRSASLTKSFTGHTRVVVGGAWVAGYNINGTLYDFRGDSGAISHCRLDREIGGGLSIVGPSGVVATTAPGFLTSGFYRYLEMDVVLDDIAGSIDLYADNDPTPLLSFAGDTRNGGSGGTIDQVRVTGPSFQQCDDIYILDGSGPAPFNAPLGQVRCYPLAPNGNGSSSQGVGSDGNSVDNYLLVDEAASAISTADYVGIFTDGNKDLYQYSNLALVGAVANVEIYSNAVKSESGPKSIRHRVRTGGLEFTGADQAMVNVNYVPHRDQFPSNPDTLAPWTPAEVNALEAGFEARP